MNTKLLGVVGGAVVVGMGFAGSAEAACLNCNATLSLEAAGFEMQVAFNNTLAFTNFSTAFSSNDWLVTSFFLDEATFGDGIDLNGDSVLDSFGLGDLGGSIFRLGGRAQAAGSLESLNVLFLSGSRLTVRTNGVWEAIFFDSGERKIVSGLTSVTADYGEFTPNGGGNPPQSVPEPASLLGLAAVAGIGLATRRKATA